MKASRNSARTILIILTVVLLTPFLLVWAAWKDDVLEYAAGNGNTKLARLMINGGADVNYQDSNNDMPLCYAVISGRKDVIEFLLSRGADVNKKGAFESSPLRFAVTHSSDIVDLLLRHGAHVDDTDSDGNTALNIACKNLDGNMVDALLRFHADPNIQNNDGATPLISAMSRENDEKMRLKDITFKLVDAGAKLGHQDTSGNSAESLAAKNGHSKIFMILKTYANRVVGKKSI